VGKKQFFQSLGIMVCMGCDNVAAGHPVKVTYPMTVMTIVAHPVKVTTMPMTVMTIVVKVTTIWENAAKVTTIIMWENAVHLVKMTTAIMHKRTISFTVK
jgi:hypothetical protein